MAAQIIECGTEWAVDRLIQYYEAQGATVTVTYDGEWWYVTVDATPTNNHR